MTEQILTQFFIVLASLGFLPKEKKKKFDYYTYIYCTINTRVTNK